MWSRQLKFSERLLEKTRLPETGVGETSGWYRLKILPFDPPSRAEVVGNYSVSFDVSPRSGRSYQSSFGVYLFKLDGKGLYFIKEPYVTAEIKIKFEEAMNSMYYWLKPSPLSREDPIGYLEAELKHFLESDPAGVELEDARRVLEYYAIRDTLGYGVIDAFMRDYQVEDISCEGVWKPVRIWHRRFNNLDWLESNLRFTTEEEMDSIVSKLVYRTGKSISTSTPILDATLPEGHRLSATWQKEITSFGSSFTVRKFRQKPMTITELLVSGTISPEIVAYLWTLIETKGFVVISGVSASGKTTLLNALATVLNPNWKVVTIEDTRELNLPHIGWKALHTRSGGFSGEGRISTFELVKLSLRERPDFVILGEARGAEVRMLFQSAATGHGCLTTFHAPNIEGLLARVANDPMYIQPSLMKLIDAIVFMAKVQQGDSVKRYVDSVVEGDEWNTLFKWSDNFWEGSLTESSRLVAKRRFADEGQAKLHESLLRKVEFLNRMARAKVFEYEPFSRELRKFYQSGATEGS